jgi:hypothetical protein
MQEISVFSLKELQLNKEQMNNNGTGNKMKTAIKYL